MSSPFGTFNDVETYEFAPGVHINAVGGEQVLLCRAAYQPGMRVTRHSHEHTEQVMLILEHGCAFIEALAPVPLDHVPVRERDLVLGPDGGSGHVER